MTNPAVEAITDAPLDSVDTSDTDAQSFLADFESQVLGRETTHSEEPERSSDPEPAAHQLAQADAPPLPADDQPSDPAAPKDDAADIPSTPLTYTVNGQEKVADWALEVKDEGVVIPREHVARFKDLIQRDEWQNAQNRELYQKTQQYDSLTYKSGDTEHKGIDAFRHLQADRAALDASGGRLMSALANPEFVTNLAVAYQNGEKEQVEALLGGVLEQVRFVGEKAGFDTMKTADAQMRDASKQQEQTQVQEQEYRSLITQYGKALPDLTPDDLRAMYDYFGGFRDRIFRPATLEEAKALGVRPGEVIRDPSLMTQWAQDRAKIRREYADATKAAQKAAAENAARQAAPRPIKGQKPPKPAKAATKSAPDAKFEGDDGSYAAWKRRLETGKWAHDDNQQET